MTKKLINRTFYILCIFAFLKLLLWIINHYNTCPFHHSVNQCKGCLVVFICYLIVAIALIIYLGIIIIRYSDGKYDNFFKRYTDPKLQQLCDFLHRRNGGCNNQNKDEVLEKKIIRPHIKDKIHDDISKIFDLIEIKSPYEQRIIRDRVLTKLKDCFDNRDNFMYE